MQPKMTFQRQVLESLREVPRGKVVTYGQIAAHLGCPSAARAVGNALHRNQDGDFYPCYKVVNSKGELSGRYAFGGLTEQQSRLEAEGIVVRDNRVDLEKYQY